ncbi:MAG: MotA/TolQ/ExbB proton channel family protein [Cytophagales bacterium]|nr:MotA/TolQ/ExbB proton channel family protein [Cytophagales bacterium]
MDNPYGLMALWAQGDWVAKGTLLVLALMSLGSWTIILSKFFDQQKLKKQAAQVDAAFWSATSVVVGTEQLSADSAYRYVAESALATEQRGRSTEQSIERALAKVQSRWSDGMTFLATVGSTAPFVGLFGTVWGIYNALVKIGVSGQASIDKVAGPVGEALIMTALGLAVAVPAVLGYNWLVRRNKLAMEHLREFGMDLSTSIK